MALTTELIDELAENVRTNAEFACAIEAEVRKQDDALIQQLVEALEQSQPYVESCANGKRVQWWGAQLDRAQDAITAARARLLDSDLSNLTERGAKAWAGVDAQALREGRWYMVTHDGVATLCEDRRDAEEEAKDANMVWPHSGPHRAVQLVEASTAGFTAADMATAAAQGFRDGVASLAANAGEPVAFLVCTEEGDPDMVFLDRLEACQYCEDDDPPKPLYLAAPPTAQAEGWLPIEGAPKDRSNIVLLRQPCGSIANGFWLAEAYAGNGAWVWPYVHKTPTHWMPLPPPPTSAEGVEHG